MTSLQNQFLIAMPSLDDGYFHKTVTYICEHDEEGAMGLIINLPVNITLGDLLKQIDEEDESNSGEEKENKVTDNASLDSAQEHSEKVTTPNTDEQQSNEVTSAPEEDNSLLEKIMPLVAEDETHSLEQLVLSGGPVGQQRGFVLHSTQKGWSSSLALNKDLMITTSKDILLALGTKAAPEKFMVTLGYASWGPGQLEEELQSNSWLTAPADNDIIFNTPIEQRWKKATNALGIDLAHLSNEIGHA